MKEMGTWFAAHRYQALGVAVVVLLLSGGFALGAVVGRDRAALMPMRGAPGQGMRGPAMGGTVGAIEGIEGDVLQLRDPRSGQTWKVRANRDTVVEAGPRRRIPVRDLRVGQRVFVLGVPDDQTWDAQFIGVMLGQPQRFLAPARPGVCEDCTD